ncbi:MAG: alpha/beta hydrolase [Bacteroidota bacterium]
MLSFHYEGITLEYEIIGNGEKAMFAFHGFNNSSAMFRTLEPSLGKNFTIYSFNLPYHGESTIDKETTMYGIDTLQFQKYFRNFLWHIHQTYFSLLGYSIGGKVALKLIELFPEEVRSVYLFAPDGIKLSFWYRFVTRSMPGRWIYKRLITHPNRYLRMVTLFEKINLVNSQTASFIRNSLDSPIKREKVYQTWMCLRNLDPDTGRIRNIVNEKNLDFHLFFGKFDKVIPALIGKRFVRGLRNKKSLHILDSGHQLVKEKTNADLENILSA